MSSSVLLRQQQKPKGCRRSLDPSAKREQRTLSEPVNAPLQAGRGLPKRQAMRYSTGDSERYLGKQFKDQGGRRWRNKHHLHINRLSVCQPGMQLEVYPLPDIRVGAGIWRPMAQRF
jgi:hypothetical protein